ncbi:MAG: aminoacyl-tRNA hydrolase [Chloroflexi bacterium]|nr:MAG: aminoacyl-tRNA hydrolase [Chloroflexota bacterium]MBL1196526.1 aminoacyl-tRNA hydrolase [Chloroflexota bacterium]NOH13822.1 aminoacyl-tRNA hydrolase [Chloroflexota bacterium]
MLKKLFGREEAENTYLIAGLGNPGKEYQDNRHNVGFMVASKLAEKLGENFSRMQSNAMIAKAQHKDLRIILAKPRTFMNNSGQAVAALVRFYKVPQHNILIIYDEADLPYETLRLRPEGRSAGQKGMKSVLQHLGTQEIARLRVGVGRPPGRMSTPDYVLQDFSKQQKETLPFVIDHAAEAALAFIEEGIETAMNQYNGAEA